MNIVRHAVPVRDLVNEYENLGYDGVTGYGGLLDIRPKFQREFIYDMPQRRAVIRTILDGFPLNIMYWSVQTDEDGETSREYVNSGEVDRQALLEKAISWIAGKGDDNIKAYMNEHRLDPNATALWLYFKSVVDWAKATFAKVRAPMRSVPWNVLYEQFKDTTLDADVLEAEVKALMEDSEVTKKSGIYEYVLTRDERQLGLRTFDDNTKREAYERQDGICPQCGEHFEYSDMDGDHILPWRDGGKTIPENCQMLCIRDNRSGRL